MFTKRQLITFFVGTGLTLIVAGLLPLVLPNRALAQDATPEPVSTPEVIPATDGAEVTPTGDNSYCAVCHSQAWRTITLQDGVTLNLFVTAEMVTSSVHQELGCVDCHGADAFPHNGPTPADIRTYRLDTVSMCATCHEQAAAELSSGLHEQAIMNGNTEAAVCTDCHGSHAIQPVSEHPELVAGVCGDCHDAELTDWRDSPHVNIGPLGCASCHQPHTQTMRVGNTSDELCLNCHNQMPTTYVHDQHFSDGYEMDCVDCHMFRADDQAFSTTSHRMFMDTQPCTTCHNQLIVDGTWQELRAAGDAELVSERDALAIRVGELEEQARLNAQSNIPTSVPLIQGLIIGLGLGLTLAVILVPRFMAGRKKS